MTGLREPTQDECRTCIKSGTAYLVDLARNPQHSEDWDAILGQLTGLTRIALIGRTRANSEGSSHETT